MADLDVQRAVSTGTCASCTVGQTVTSGGRSVSCAKTSSTNIQREVLGFMSVNSNFNKKLNYQDFESWTVFV